ncbi:MAG: diaminopimelate epimerase [Armatimonadota bacterium]|nr:diaminopimelate epimerase [Armatimonadota bacterium]
MKLPFHKYQSIGNDFVLLEERNVADLFPGCSLDDIYPKLAISLCERKLGIGSDGLLTYFRDAEVVHMRMFNPDGSEDFCGNGLRCAALHAQRKGAVNKELTLLHRGKEVLAGFSLGGWIDVGLPRPDFDPSVVPLAAGVGEVFDRPLEVGKRTVRVSAVNVGSTHAVLAVDGPPEEVEFQELGPAIENHAWFPERTSVIWCWQRDDRFNAFAIRIWERGVGETLGCGTGSAAAAACIFRDRPLVVAEIKNPGGDCAVALGPEGTLNTSAKAHHVFSGMTVGEYPSGILPSAQEDS